MPGNFVDALFAFVADDAKFFAGYFWFDYFCFELYAFDERRTDCGFITVDYHQHVSLELFCAFREEVHREGLFFGCKVLFATDFNDCFHVLYAFPYKFIDSMVDCNRYD